MLADIADIATAFAALSTLIAVLALIRELRYQGMESFRYLHEFLSKDELQEARRTVRTELRHKRTAVWSESDRVAANRVCASYDQCGLLIQERVLKGRMVRVFLLSSWGQSIEDQYTILREYLTEMQPQQQGFEFFKHFEWLYHETLRIRAAVSVRR